MATIGNDRDPNQPIIYESREIRTADGRRDTRRDDISARRDTPATHDEKVTTGMLTGASSFELLGGAGAVVLAVIGLTGTLPLYMTAISTIAIGAALLAHGAASAARWNDTVGRAAADKGERVELGSGLGSEVLGGIAGIVLGVLALAGILPMVLLAVAAIVVGGTVLLGAPAHPDLARYAPDPDRRVGRYTYEAVEAGAGTMALAGVAAVILGILALIGVEPALTLIMVAMLSLGGALLLAGGTLAARFIRRLQRT